jgi:outer membrane protein assembly factor BamB
MKKLVKIKSGSSIISIMFLLVTLITTHSLKAQNEEVWSADLDGSEIVWTKLVPNRDVLLVGTKKMIVYGIDAETGKKIWESTAVRPIGGKLLMTKENKEQLKKQPEAFFDDRVRFEEDPENEELNKIVAIFDGNMTSPTLVNVNTGFEMNYLPAYKMSLSAYFYDDTKLLTGTAEQETVMRSLPSGDVIWTNETNINTTPLIDEQGFIYINSSFQGYDASGSSRAGAQSANFTDKNATLAKVDPDNGNTLWQITEKGDMFTDAQFIGNDKVLFFRLKDETTAKSIDMVDANSGNMLWQFDVSKDKANIEYSSVSPDGNTMYVLMRRNKRVDFFALNLQNGQRRWLQEFKLKKEDQASLVATNYGAAVVSVKRVRAFDLANGEQKWEHKYSGDVPGYLMEAEGGELLLFSDGDIESLDPKTGDDIWDAKGGYLLKLYDDRMLASFKSKGCVMIDLKTGERIWKSKVFVQDIIVDAPGIGLVYKESDNKGTEMNILNLETGKPIWDKSIENPGAELVTEKGTMLIYSEGRILEFDPNTGQYSVFMDDIKFEHKEEPNKIIPYGDNLLVSSSQNMMLVTKTGDIIYQIDYKPAPQKVGNSILGGFMAVGALAGAAMSTGAAMQEGANAGYARSQGNFVAADRYQDKADGATAMAGAFAGLAMEGISYATKKFKKTKSSANYTFMLAKENKDIKIVKLSKANGEKENELIFKDREPVYLYDAERQKLYYRTDKSVMSCFAF